MVTDAAEELAKAAQVVLVDAEARHSGLDSVGVSDAPRGSRHVSASVWWLSTGSGV